MRKSLHRCYVAVLCALPCAGLAQHVDDAPKQDNVFIMSRTPFMPFAGTVDVVGSFGSVVGGVVKGKPYSADAVTESSQILADGNRITTRNETRLFRDGEGRTRRELTLNALGVWQPVNQQVSITIDDPVAGESYVLDPAAQTARKLRQFKVALPEGGVAQWTEAAIAPPPAGADGGQPHTVAFSSEIRGTVSGGAPLEPPPLPAIHPAQGAGVRALPPVNVVRMARAITATTDVAVNREDLGEQVLEGVLARGSRTTQTIPAGAIGNERDIEIVAEEWYSDALETVVLRRNFDPRFGETTYRLINVRLGEPSPDLFAVPQGYELVDERFEAPAISFPGAPAPGVRREFGLRRDPERADD